MILTELLKLIEPLSQPLAQVEETLVQECRSSRYQLINKAAQHITLDHGKRLRPILVLSVAQALGPITHGHTLLSVILELIHTATLLHDDVLDEADTRRHRVSVNSQWGNATSVLLGDYLFARALILLSSLGSKDLFGLVSETTRDICEGEILQISSSRKADLLESLYYEIIRKKTASLFAASCKGSAMISGCDAPTVEALRQYGYEIGQAFQITDDILDLVGNPNVEGKTLGTDLKKGKMTLPLIHLFSRLDEDERSYWTSIVNQSNNGVSDLQIQHLLAHPGLEKTLQAVNVHCEAALALIKTFPSNFDLSLFYAIPEYLKHQAKNYLSQSQSVIEVS